MRVLHVANGRLFGGIERMLVTLAEHRGLTPRIEHAFAIACPGRLADELQDCDAPVQPLGHVRLRQPRSIVAGRALLKETFDRHRPDVMIAHAPWAYALFAGVARRRRVPVIWWQHDAATGRPLVERWARTMPAELVISNSRWTARSASRVQPHAPLDVVYCPVALREAAATARSDIRATFGATNAHVVILAASRLEPWKGHLMLLRALELLKGNPTWVLWVAGGAQRPHEIRYLARIQQTVAELGLRARVRFLGDRRDMPVLMAGADLLVQANEGPEPFGVVFAEALLSRLPVVTTDMGGAPEIVDNTCGRLVTPGDVPGLADCLAELIADPKLRGRLGAAGRVHALERCAPSVIMPRLARALAPFRATAAA